MPTTVTGAALVNSTVDSTSIGGSAPSTAAFTSASVSGNFSVNGLIQGATGGGVVTVRPTTGATNDFVVQNAAGSSNNLLVQDNGTIVAPGTMQLGTALASSDNSTNVPNTTWTKFGLSILLAANGYIKFPTWLGGGLLIQWGAANAATSSQNVTFPTAFPAAVWAVICQPLNFGPNAGRATPYLDAVSTSGFTQTSAGSTNSIYWFAIGH
jgi:hypothetical protein